MGLGWGCWFVGCMEIILKFECGCNWKCWGGVCVGVGWLWEVVVLW